MIRKVYEHLNLYIYLYIPVSLAVLYSVIVHITGNVFLLNDTFIDNSIEISLTILGILLTLLGLFAALPKTKYDEGMEKYGYYKIIFNTLFIGVLATIIHLITNLLSLSETLEVYLFIIYMSETVVATVWIYRILRLIYSSDTLRK